MKTVRSVLRWARFKDSHSHAAEARTVMKSVVTAVDLLLLAALGASSQGQEGRPPLGDSTIETRPPIERGESVEPTVWGALAFTADGSYATAWKAPSKAEAEADVAKRCARLGRGACEVVSFRGEL